MATPKPPPRAEGGKKGAAAAGARALASIPKPEAATELPESLPPGHVRVERYMDDGYWSGGQSEFNYPKVLARLRDLRDTGELWLYDTLIIDSVTSMELIARKWHQLKLNPGTSEPRQWYGGSTDELESFLYVALGSLEINVCVVAHIDEKKDEVSGAMVRNPAAPGRLSKRLPAGYSELYHMYCKRGDSGDREHWLQTHTDGRFNANTMLDLDDHLHSPGWDDLWVNWPDGDKPWVHALVYGDPGVGKSTFAATWPTPMLVFMFDPIGKEVPYIKGLRRTDSGQVYGVPYDVWGPAAATATKAAKSKR